MPVYTRGNWRYGLSESHEYYEIFVDDPTDKLGGEINIADLSVEPNRNQRERQEANARLIAAAPDLVEALQPLVARLRRKIEADDYSWAEKAELLAAEAALKKALGT